MIRETDLETFSLKAQFAKHAQDFGDQQNEMAGRDVGRITRFLNADTREEKIDSKRGNRKQADLTNLQILLLNNPAYQELFRETEKRLRETQTRLDTTLEAILLAKEEARANGDDDRLNALDHLEADIRDAQAEIGDMQVQMDDEDDPPSAEELEEFQNRAEEIIADIEQRAAAELNRDTPAPTEASAPVQSSSTIDVPKL